MKSMPVHERVPVPVPVLAHVTVSVPKAHMHLYELRDAVHAVVVSLDCGCVLRATGLNRVCKEHEPTSV
jgi:hypothetical protein